MPNFDRTGPLKYGRVIGRGMGPSNKGNEYLVFPRKDVPEHEKEIINTG
jgi:hypothetical protein